MKLAISLATRGRPDRLIEALKVSSSNWTNKDTVLYVQLDEDDQTLDQTLSLLRDIPSVLDNIIIPNVAPREDTVAAKWNRITDIPADVYAYHADDDPYTTLGYDQKILDAAARFPDGIGAVFGHLANMSFSCTYAAKYVQKLGFLLPEYFPYWFCDHWTDDLAKMIGRISFANIRTDQSRPGVTLEMREPGWWATWFDAAYLMRRQQALSILNDPEFECPDWQKDLLIAGFPLIDSRSRMINHNVRQQNAQLSQWAGNLKPDERYNRIKKRAVDMVPHLLNDFGMPEQEREMFCRFLIGAQS